ncbi:MAG TPA: 3-oxoacyl-ACP reductase family protein [Candidatus Polarisedimenticolaceae bacterium]|nr:3-oxoacyl-ACP reductase family protein [Candidatus Polarisedimenticolaceae bacterium]
MIDLNGKSALVTGGARGIGRACCLMLARSGASVAVNYRVETPSAELLVEEIEAMGAEAFALAADVSQRADAEMLVDETVARFGGIDILVNNAGIWKSSPIEEMSDNEWAEMLAVNLTGAFHCTRAAVPAMKEARSGRIINIASTAGQRGEAFCSHYAATKGGLISFTKSLASELASSGILVNCVAPGWVVTDMTREDLLGARRESILQTIPLARAGTPDEIAGAVLYLASDLSTFVTGEILNVNGGAVLVG